MQDLTLIETRDAMRAVAKEIGPKADISVWLASECFYGSEALVRALIRPNGILGKERIEATGETFRELVENCRLAWAEHADLHAANTIRDMALAIIRLTHALGSCTDAALRAEFDAQDVERFGDRACERANEMGGSGPFSIVPLAGANDAEAA